MDILCQEYIHAFDVSVSVGEWFIFVKHLQGHCHFSAQAPLRGLVHFPTEKVTDVSTLLQGDV